MRVTTCHGLHGRRRRSRTPQREAASGRWVQRATFASDEASLQDDRPVRADRRPAARDRGAVAVDRRREPLPDAARRDRHGQDGDHGLDDREASAPGARHRPQQDARRTALQRVPGVLPGQRGRVLRLLLRLLPAGGVCPASGPVHREGLVPERRHRAAAALGDRLAADAPRRGGGRVGLLHLRPRLAGGVARAAARARGGTGARPGRGAAQAHRQPVRAERHRARARPIPRQGRRRRDPARERGDGVPGLVLRRRGRADHALRPAYGRGVCAHGQPRDLAGDRVHHLATDDRTGGGRDPGRARTAGREVRDRGSHARGAPSPPAHGIRHGDAERARLHERHRELLARARGAAGGLAPVHAHRLLPGRLRHLRRRVAPDRPSARRDVRGRPLAQADARGLRLPAPVRARQPPAPLRRVPRQGAAARLPVGHARARSSCRARASSPSS